MFSESRYRGDGFRVGVPGPAPGDPHPQGPHSASSSSAGVTSPLSPRTHRALPSPGITGHALGLTAGPQVSGGGRGVGEVEQTLQPDSYSHSSDRRTETKLQSRPRLPPPPQMFKASSVAWNFYRSKWRGKRNTFLVCFFGDIRPGQVQFPPQGLSDISLPELIFESE